MKLSFDRVLRVPPSEAWPLLTIPEQMNEWSEAKVTAVTPGPNGKHDAVGAKRQVRIKAFFGLASTLHEDVVEAVYPSRFVYRVTGGGGVRNHRGTIELTPSNDGASLLWQVEFEGVIPGIERILGTILRPRLGRSLDRLVQVAEGKGVARGLS